MGLIYNIYVAATFLHALSALYCWLAGSETPRHHRGSRPVVADVLGEGDIPTVLLPFQLLPPASAKRQTDTASLVTSEESQFNPLLTYSSIYFKVTSLRFQGTTLPKIYHHIPCENSHGKLEAKVKNEYQFKADARVCNLL